MYFLMEAVIIWFEFYRRFFARVQYILCKHFKYFMFCAKDAEAITLSNDDNDSRNYTESLSHNKFK